MAYGVRVLSPPVGLTDDALTAVLRERWGLAVDSLAYRPVGWGSHHWEAVDSSGARWFVTVDELAKRRYTRTEPLDVAFERLRASFTAARDLYALGHSFVVAPVPADDGEPVVRLGGAFAVTLSEFVVGRSFEWGEYAGPAHRQAILDLVVAVHSTPVRAMVDDFAVPHRDELEAALRGDDPGPCGPYVRESTQLLVAHAAPVRRLLGQYDALVARARAQPDDRSVLTHGEPHPGNTMLAAGGWRLIDWDTALVAPPERDLWSLDPGDGSLLDTYADATGVVPLPWLLELYRIRWDLADNAVDVARFRLPHTGGPDDATTWDLLRQRVSGA